MNSMGVNAACRPNENRSRAVMRWSCGVASGRRRLRAEVGHLGLGLPLRSMRCQARGPEAPAHQRAAALERSLRPNDASVAQTRVVVRAASAIIRRSRAPRVRGNCRRRQQRQAVVERPATAVEGAPLSQELTSRAPLTPRPASRPASASTPRETLLPGPGALDEGRSKAASRATTTDAPSAKARTEAASPRPATSRSAIPVSRDTAGGPAASAPGSGEDADHVVDPGEHRVEGEPGHPQFDDSRPRPRGRSSPCRAPRRRRAPRPFAPRLSSSMAPAA